MSAEKNIYEDGTYLENNPTWHAEDSSWKAEKITRILRKNKISPATICEIGCGSGEIINCLTKEFGEATLYSGYEISPQAFEICRKKESKNLKFFLKDLLGSDEKEFDVVMAIDIFEHVENYFSFLRRLRKKGTYKVFHIPLEISAQAILRGSITNDRATIGHIHYFTKKSALAALRETGYEIVDTFYTCGSLDLPNRGWKSNLLKIPRKLFFSINKDLAVRIFGGFSLLVLAK